MSRDRIAAQSVRHRHGVEAFRIPEPGLLVEGIAYDPVEHAFYTGSGSRRKIVKIVEGRLVASKEFDVSSTPTFFINGTKFTGAPTVEEFDRVLSGLSAKS